MKAFAKEVAKASGPEVLSSRGKVFRKGSRRENTPALVSPKLALDIVSTPTPSS
jgi:hypothetical protein